MRKLHIATLFSVVAVGLAVPPVDAYEIKPKRSIHEAMTRLAIRCARAAADQPPADCRGYHGRIDNIAGFPGSWFANFSKLEESVRWPDDPLRQLKSPIAWAGFLTSVGYSCDAAQGGEEVLALHRRGLLCSSHYGRLQYLHSMASSRAEAGEPATTKRKMLDWADLTYGVASGRINLDQSYCAYFQANRSSISDDLAPKDFPFCDAQPDGSGRYTEGWKLGTLFSLKCWIPGGRGCTEFVGEKGGRLARRAATGALLHMIQDSYSQSHAARGPALADGSYEPIVECALPSKFYYFNDQSKAGHGEADKPPSLSERCITGAKVDDAITASAVILWHLERNSDPNVVRQYLEQRVFGPVETASLSSGTSP